MTKGYGTSRDETEAQDTLRCRQIVRTIVDYGVNEAQKLKLIYLLALELENREHLQEITALAKRLEAGGQAKSTLITDVT